MRAIQLGHGRLERQRPGSRCLPGFAGRPARWRRHGLNTAHTSGHAAFGHHLEQADIARALHVGAAAQLRGWCRCRARARSRRTFRQTASWRRSSGRIRCPSRAHRWRCWPEFPFTRRSISRIFSSVTGALWAQSQSGCGRHSTRLPFAARLPSTSRRALCMMCVTEWLRMVAARTAGVHLGLHRVAHVQVPSSAPWWPNTSALIFCVSSTANTPAGDHALVAHLAAAFGVERRRVQHHHAVLTGLQGSALSRLRRSLRFLQFQPRCS